MNLTDRLMRHVTVDPATECWMWQGDRIRGGYGRTKVNGRKLLAHRVMYETLVGPIPLGLTLDHLCRVRPCCNPAHLEPVSNRENSLRGESFAAHNARKTHCKRGHPFEGDNFYVNQKGSRICRPCGNLTSNQRYHARRAAQTGRTMSWSIPRPKA